MGSRFRRPLRPEWFHGTVAVVLTLLLAAAGLLLVRTEWTRFHLLAAWLAGVNATTFGYYGFDKYRARRGERRVPEIVLHGLALFGGSLGAVLGMWLFRHKTIKGPFRFVFWVIVGFQVLLIVGVAVALWRSDS